MRAPGGQAGSGQIGSALVSSAPQDYEIYAPDSRRLDIKSIDSIADAFESFRPDLVINCAAYTAVDKAETERELAFAINAGGQDQHAGGYGRIFSPPMPVFLSGLTRSSRETPIHITSGAMTSTDE